VGRERKTVHESKKKRRDIHEEREGERESTWRGRVRSEGEQSTASNENVHFTLYTLRLPNTWFYRNRRKGREKEKIERERGKATLRDKITNTDRERKKERESESALLYYYREIQRERYIERETRTRCDGYSVLL
jgi:hypothetical protein